MSRYARRSDGASRTVDDSSLVADVADVAGGRDTANGRVVPGRRQAAEHVREGTRMMPADTAATSSPSVSDDVLLVNLRGEALRHRLPAPAHIRRRLASTYQSTASAEILECVLADGAEWPVLWKHAVTRQADPLDTRSGLAYETQVYEHILAPDGHGQPRFSAPSTTPPPARTGCSRSSSPPASGFPNSRSTSPVLRPVGWGSSTVTSNDRRSSRRGPSSDGMTRAGTGAGSTERGN